MYLSDFQKKLIEDIITQGKYDIFEFLYNNGDIDLQDTPDSKNFKGKIIARSNYSRLDEIPHFIIRDATLMIEHINEYICLIEFLKSQNIIYLQISNRNNVVKFEVSKPSDNGLRDYINDELLSIVSRYIIIPSPELEKFKSKNYQTNEEIEDSEEREDRKVNLRYTRIALYITTTAILVNILVEIFKSIFN